MNYKIDGSFYLIEILSALKFFDRTFWKPNVIPELVTAGIEALHIAILENLASKSMLPTIIPFRQDVFRFLFHEKGTTSNDGKYIFLDKRDFTKCSWASDWDQLVDRLGDGVKPDYPIKFRLFISQSPRNHTLVDGQIKQSPPLSLREAQC